MAGTGKRTCVHIIIFRLSQLSAISFLIFFWKNFFLPMQGNRTCVHIIIFRLSQLSAIPFLIFFLISFYPCIYPITTCNHNPLHLATPPQRLLKLLGNLIIIDQSLQLERACLIIFPPVQYKQTLNIFPSPCTTEIRHIHYVFVSELRNHSNLHCLSGFNDI